MTMWLRQSTASQEILLGPCLDSTDGNTPETALTIANTDIKLWKEGATAEVSKNSGGATHIASGRYYAVLDATDTNTLGKLEVNIHVAGALAVRREYMVLPANVYDSLVLGTDNLDVTTVNGTVTTLTNLPSIPAGWLTAAGIASGALNGKGDWLDAPGAAAAVWNAAISSYGTSGSYGLLIETNLDVPVSTVGGGSLTESGIADAVWDELLSGHAIPGSTGAGLSAAGGSGDPWATLIPGAYGAGTAGKILGDNINATISSRATQTSVDMINDFVDTEVAAIKAKTDNLPSDPADASDIAAAIAIISGKVDNVKAETASIQADTNDIQARIPAALVSGRMDSNLGAIDNSTTALASFKRGVKGNVIGTVGVGSTTTSIVTSALTPAASVSTQLKGRIITFMDDTTTAALRGQSTDISASSASATPTLTVTAMTTAAASGDTFVIS